MEPELIELAKSFGPWFAGGVMVFLARKELLSFFTAARNDGAVERLLIGMNGLLTEMNRQFAQNMEMFHVTNGHLASAKTDIANQVEITRDILAELLRQTEILRVKR